MRKNTPVTISIIAETEENKTTLPHATHDSAIDQPYKIK